MFTMTLLLVAYALGNFSMGGPSIKDVSGVPTEADAAAETLRSIVPGAVSVPAVTDASQSPLSVVTLAPFQFDIAGAEQTWRNWMARHGITAGSFALGIDGEILHSAGQRRSPDAAYPVASLSKAITAMCLGDILTGTEYDWNSTLGDLAPVLDAVNMMPHQGAQLLSLGDLATHSTGFPKNLKGVETAGEGRNLYTQQHIAREALNNPAHLSANGRSAYSNVNYAVLGQVITALSGLAYEDACKPRVMIPAGANGAIVGGRMWATAGFGGWSASAEDYARFVMYWMAPDRPWVTAPADFPYNERKKAGLGVFQSTNKNGGYLIHHTGLWKSKKAERQHGALFLSSETGATFVANWQGSLPKNAYRDLRKALAPHLR